MPATMLNVLFALELRAVIATIQHASQATLDVNRKSILVNMAVCIMVILGESRFFVEGLTKRFYPTTACSRRCLIATLKALMACGVIPLASPGEGFLFFVSTSTVRPDASLETAIFGVPNRLFRISHTFHGLGGK